jgi:hypothetical protein
MKPDALVSRVIEIKLASIKSLCRTKRDYELLSKLKDIWPLLWKHVMRREKTRPKASDRGKDVMPQEERKLQFPAVNSTTASRWMQTVHPEHPEREMMVQAYAVAELLFDLFIILRNSDRNMMVQTPKSSISEVRLRSCADELAVLEQAYRERARRFAFRAEMHRATGSLAKADAEAAGNLAEADADLTTEASWFTKAEAFTAKADSCFMEAEALAAKADKDIACAAILRQAEQVLSERSRDEALSKEDEEPPPQSRQRTDPLDKLIADQISIAVTKRFGRPLDDFVARIASTLLSHEVSKQVVTSARKVRAVASFKLPALKRA